MITFTIYNNDGVPVEFHEDIIPALESWMSNRDCNGVHFYTGELIDEARQGVIILFDRKYDEWVIEDVIYVGEHGHEQGHAFNTLEEATKYFINQAKEYTTHPTPTI